ncbi:MAG: hypothetical protein OEU93_17395, partial [Rubrivivax sp.]|nr:hypothetical protein [Rubrivivax sp.]
MEWRPARSSSSTGIRRPWLAPLIALALASPAQAGSRLLVTAASVEADGMTARRVEALVATRGSAGLQVAARAGRIDGLPGVGRLVDLRLSCRGLETAGKRLHCDGGRLVGDLGQLGRQDAALEFALEANGDFHFSIARLVLGGGGVEVAGTVAAG